MCILAVRQSTSEGTPSFAGGAVWAQNQSAPPAVVNSDESARALEFEESAAAPPIDEALLGAATARRFDVVEQLARELEARRVTRTRTSVQIDARRKGPV
jgi:hypothetical protein